MTNEEFSNEFDVLLNSHAFQAQFGDQDSLYSIEVNEYEKSVELTKAQEELVRSLYLTDNTGISFEANEKIRRSLESLVKQETLSANNDDDDIKLTDAGDKFKHTTYNLPNRCWYIVYEQVKQSEEGNDCIATFIGDVVPTTHDDYWRTRNNPFRGPTKKRVLRLDNYDNTVELVSQYNISEYIIRYIEKPSPIILEDLPGNLTIEGFNTEKECQLHDSLHRTILELAVQQVLQSRAVSNKTTSDKSKDK